MTRPPPTLRAEAVVIGSGPGGSITAALAAEAGRDVLLIEEGPFLPLESCTPFTRGEMVQKYRNGGITAALGPAKVNYVEGRCVGGGSEINSGLYHRTPGDILERWRRDFAVAELHEADLLPHWEACERDVSVGLLPGAAPPASLKLHDGAARLGWKSLEVPRWFRYEPQPDPAAVPRGTRQSMTKTFVPRFLAAGGRLLPDTRVVGLRRDGGGWTVVVRHAAAGRVEIAAGTVFVAAGAIQTPALLRRSGVTAAVGDSLAMHPTVKVVARFAEPVNNPGMGVPVHQVKEFAPRFSFGCSISSPPHLGLAMADVPGGMELVREHWRHMAVYYAMIAADAPGDIRPVPGFADPLVRYRLADAHMRELAEALAKLCRALLAAGAEELYPSVTGLASVRSGADADELPDRLPFGRTQLMTIHLMGTTPMGEDRRRCAADSFGRVHGVPGLHIADAGLLCGPPGVNPQGSVMAVARRNVLRWLGAG